MKLYIDVNFNGLSLTVDGDYIPAIPESTINPRDPAVFEIRTVKLAGSETSDMDSFLTHYGLWEDLEQACLEEIQGKEM